MQLAPLPRRVPIGGTIIRVRELPRVIDPKSRAECDGFYDVARSEIHILRSLSLERKWLKLVHELAHAAFDVTGADVKLEEALGRDRARDLEEDLIETVVCTALIGALRQLGIVRFAGRTSR